MKSELLEVEEVVGEAVAMVVVSRGLEELVSEASMGGRGGNVDRDEGEADRSTGDRHALELVVEVGMMTIGSELA